MGKKTLLFDLTASQPNGGGKRHGGGKYCEKVFLAMCTKKASFKAFYDSSKYINPVILDSIKQNNIELHDIKNQNLQDLVSQQGITHLYTALPELIRPWPSCKILGTIHGLRSYEMPFDFFTNWQFDSGKIGFNTLLAFFLRLKEKKRLKSYYKKLLHSDQFEFITVSNHSKQIIQQLCPDKDIPIFYSPSTSNKECTQQKKESYFLLVSANRVEKNCIRAIIALDQLYSQKKISTNIKVKITGLSQPLFRYRLKNPSCFDFLGYVEEGELGNLYASCYGFIYPSLNEGFGYPPLEAMQYGIPIIASTAASIPEVCGQAALYFKPKSIQQLKDRIVKITNNTIHNDLSQKSLEQFKIITQRQKEDTEKLIDWIISSQQH